LILHNWLRSSSEATAAPYSDSTCTAANLCCYKRIVAACLVIALPGLFGCSAGRDPGPTYRQAATPLPIELPDRPAHFGITLPVPDNHALIKNAGSLQSVSGNLVPILLGIDTGGAVFSVEPVVPSDSLLMTGERPQLLNLMFQPGMIDSIVSPMQLPALMLVRDDSSLIGLVTPVSSQNRMTDPDLYSVSLALNGYRQARLAAFPSYFCLREDTDSIAVPSYVSALIDLNENGRPTRIESNGSTPPLADQILTAMNWAEYIPAERNGQRTEGGLQITVILYPEVICPTEPVKFPLSDSVGMYEHNRIIARSSFADLLMLPVPVNLKRGLLYSYQPVANLPDTGLAIIRIDGAGNPTLVFTNPSSVKTRENYLKVVASLRFYPALNSLGQAVSFTGRLSIYGTDSRNVRVSCDWLASPLWLRQFQTLLIQ